MLRRIFNPLIHLIGITICSNNLREVIICNIVFPQDTTEFEAYDGKIKFDCTRNSYRDPSIKQFPLLNHYPKMLKHLPNLQSIVLSSCAISEIDVIGLDNLRILKIDKNQHKLSLKNEMFNDQSNLVELEISETVINAIENSAFEPLKSLEILKLYKNQLKSIPESVERLKKLKILNLNGNNLTMLPDNLGDLVSLTMLYLANNQLESIPESIGKMNKLQALGLSDNNLTMLPDNLGDLVSLTILNLASNQLESIPESIGKMNKLQALDLSDNNLTMLPDNLGDLESLTMLYLANNQLESIPESIRRLKKLKILNLSDNNLTKLTDSLCGLASLTILNLANNRLESIPESIGRLKKLKILNLSGNNLKHLPASIKNMIKNNDEFSLLINNNPNFEEEDDLENNLLGLKSLIELSRNKKGFTLYYENDESEYETIQTNN